jgi:hypothetical protein
MSMNISAYMSGICLRRAKYCSVSSTSVGPVAADLDEERQLNICA